MNRPAGRARRVSKCRGSGQVGRGLVRSGLVWSGPIGLGVVWSGRVRSGRVWSGLVGSSRIGSSRVNRFSNLADQVRSCQEILNSHGTGRVGSREFQIVPGRVRSGGIGSSSLRCGSFMSRVTMTRELFSADQRVGPGDLANRCFFLKTHSYLLEGHSRDPWIRNYTKLASSADTSNLERIS